VAVTANAYMTLDGRGAFPKYPDSERPSTEVTALFRHMWFERFADVTTVVRRSFSTTRQCGRRAR
jgi:hypothetical protein